MYQLIEEQSAYIFKVLKTYVPLYIILPTEIQIGFEFPEYTFLEQDANISTVFLIKEQDRVSEQTFEISIRSTDRPGSLAPATLGVDYNPASQMVIFRPDQQRFAVSLTLIDDDLLEETEDFRFEASRASDTATPFRTGTNPETDIFILEDDGKSRRTKCQGLYTPFLLDPSSFLPPPFLLLFSLLLPSSSFLPPPSFSSFPLSSFSVSPFSFSPSPFLPPPFFFLLSPSLLPSFLCLPTYQPTYHQ